MRNRFLVGVLSIIGCLFFTVPGFAATIRIPATLGGRASYQNFSGAPWSTIITATGNASNGTQTASTFTIAPHTSANKWIQLDRPQFRFPTQDIPEISTIQSVAIELWVNSKTDPGNLQPQYAFVFEEFPFLSSGVSSADYARMGSSTISSVIAYNNIVTNATNTFYLNTSTLYYLSTTATTTFGLREYKYDLSSTTPTWYSGVSSTLNFMNTAAYNKNGTTSTPVLVITYNTIASSTASSTINYNNQPADLYIAKQLSYLVTIQSVILLLSIVDFIRRIVQINKR